MSARTRVRRFLALAVGVLSCGPELAVPETRSEEALRFARAKCEALAQCKCTVEFETIEDCEGAFASQFDRVRGDLDVADECLDTFLDQPETWCDRWTSENFEPTPMPEYLACPIIDGTKKLGEPCSVGRLDAFFPFTVQACEEELTCCNGRCQQDCNNSVNSCTGNGRGGDRCTSACDCNSTLFCEGIGITGREGVCAPRREIGASCDPLDFYPCVTTAFPEAIGWCDPDEHRCVVGEPTLCRISHPLWDVTVPTHVADW